MILGIEETMTKERVTVVKIKSNGDIEYKVLNSIGTDMGWVKWSIIFLFAALLCPVFLKSLGVVVVEIVAGVLAAIGIGTGSGGQELLYTLLTQYIPSKIVTHA